MQQTPHSAQQVRRDQDGDVRAWKKPENTEGFTCNCGVSAWPAPPGTARAEAADHTRPETPWPWTSRSAGAGRVYSHRIAAIFARNSVVEPDQPTRSTLVATSIVCLFAGSSRTVGANNQNSPLQLVGDPSAPDPTPGNASPFHGKPQDPADPRLKCLAAETK